MEVAETRFRAMASECHVIVVGRRCSTASKMLLSDAEEHIRHLERRWSRFLPDSDTTRLNGSGGRPTVVDPSTVILCTSMLRAWQITGGRFDPTILPAILDAGYDSSVDDPTRRTRALSATTRVGGVDRIEIDSDRATVALPANVAIDPGGIGKGLAADLTVAQLLEGGALGALVGIGGDIAMGGCPPEPRGWRVAVEHAERGAGDLCTLTVSHGSAATSSILSRCWITPDGARHHIVDPRTGTQATTDLAAVTVIAQAGWLAEAHATAALLAGSDHVLDYLEARALTGLAQRLDGARLATSDLPDVPTSTTIGTR